MEISIWDRVYYIKNKIVHFEAPIDLNKNGISGLKDGAKDDHAVNFKQVNAVESQVTTVNNKVTQNKTDIATMGYYYFTDQLKHNNSNTVKFPAVSNNYPYSADNNSRFLTITLDGHYQIIYTDFYAKGNIKKSFHNS